mmetsp:Transcript_42186/g.126364  ORF Transcript_42186/g.126364 Transcript_42186/m.126364 type:complete len:336 (+) Transcript_42186:143-1150(+)
MASRLSIGTEDQGVHLHAAPIRGMISDLLLQASHRWKLLCSKAALESRRDMSAGCSVRQAQPTVRECPSWRSLPPPSPRSATRTSTVTSVAPSTVAAQGQQLRPPRGLHINCELQGQQLGIGHVGGVGDERARDAHAAARHSAAQRRQLVGAAARRGVAAAAAAATAAAGADQREARTRRGAGQARCGHVCCHALRTEQLRLKRRVRRGAQHARGHARAPSLPALGPPQPAHWWHRKRRVQVAEHCAQRGLHAATVQGAFVRVRKFKTCVERWRRRRRWWRGGRAGWHWRAGWRRAWAGRWQRGWWGWRRRRGWRKRARRWRRRRRRRWVWGSRR